MLGKKYFLTCIVSLLIATEKCPDRRTDLSRNTIRKYLRSDGVEPQFKVPDRPSKLDSFADRLAAWLKTEATRPRKQKRMGHASTRTAGRYARKQSDGSGTSSMTAVWASGIVREFGNPNAPKKVRSGRYWHRTERE